MKKRAIEYLSFFGWGALGASTGYFLSQIVHKHFAKKEEVVEEPKVRDTDVKSPSTSGEEVHEIRHETYFKTETKPDIKSIIDKYSGKEEKGKEEETVMEPEDSLIFGTNVWMSPSAFEDEEDEDYDIVTLIYHPEGPNSGRYLVNRINGAVLNEDMVEEDLGIDAWDLLEDAIGDGEDGCYCKNDQQRVYYEILVGDVGYDE